MRWPTLSAPLPLLAKELVEQSARRRTYVLRVVCAALLFTVFCAFTYGIFERAQYGSAQLGRAGREMFEAIVYIQFVGILIFQPALMSGVLAAEKERQSLSLLLLTDLRPREILLQKYVSRLIPMFTILLLSLPLLALSYAFGGVSPTYLLTGIYVLALTSLQVGALALMCSSFCRTSLGAFLASYILGALYYLGVPLALALLRFADPLGTTRGAGIWGTFMPVMIFASLGWGSWSRGQPATVAFGAVVGQSTGILVSIGVFLLLARAFLLRRAFLSPKNELLLIFRAIDRFFNAMNKGFGNVVLVRDRDDLPVANPIAWREVTRKSLGKVRYLFRILVILEVPTLFVGLFCLAVGRPTSEAGSLSSWLIVVWILSALAVTVTSANTIVSERIHQTLDVLLTTPISGPDILRQKLRGVRRLICVLLIPFVSIFLLEAWWRETVGPRGYGYSRYGDWGAGSYLISSVLLVVIYLPMLSWFAMWVSLKSRTRFRAILTALMAIVGWIALPWLVAALLDVTGVHHDWSNNPTEFVLMLSSPATMILVTEYGLPVNVPLPLLIALNTMGYGGMLVLFRTLCLNRADRLLGRADPQHPPPYADVLPRRGEAPG